MLSRRNQRFNLMCGWLIAALVLPLVPSSARAQDAQTPAPKGPVRISAGVAAHGLIDHPNPVYPAEAKADHVQGIVVLHGIISKTGEMESVTVISGPAMLQSAALDAVRRWRYKPYLLNGEPTAVDTTINVNFTFVNTPTRQVSSEPPAPPQ